MENETMFEGWAVVELFGHNREVGFVTTHYFGASAMFQVDVPELPEREVVLESPEYVDGGDGRDYFAPAGSTVKRAAVPGRSRLVSPSAVYAINPCSEEMARRTIERNAPRRVVLVQCPREAALPVARAEVQEVTE